jgi:hypothetical protein
MPAIDHVIYACGDLDAAAARFETDFGLPSVAGGRHVGLGTANRIVPLVGAYIELLAVVDEAEAQGQPLAAMLRGPDRFVGWMLRTDGIDAVAERLGIDVVPMARRLPDGHELRWRLAGLGDPFLPTFIQWDVEPARHPAAGGTAPLIELALRGDRGRLEAWAGGPVDRVSVTPGAPTGTVSVTVDVAGRTVTIT